MERGKKDRQPQVQRACGVTCFTISPALPLTSRPPQVLVLQEGLTAMDGQSRQARRGCRQPPSSSQSRQHLLSTSCVPGTVPARSVDDVYPSIRVTQSLSLLCLQMRKLRHGEVKRPVHGYR